MVQGRASFVNGGAIAFLVPGFKLLQAGRLPSPCADEETETQSIEKSCPRPPETESAHPDPSPVLSFLCTHFLPCPCRFGPGCSNSPWLPADVGDRQPPGGVPGDCLKFLLWLVAKADVLIPSCSSGLPSQPGGGSSRICAPAHCRVEAQGPGHWPHVSLACG